MKRILFTFLFVMAIMAGYSQLQNNGGTITVQDNATLVIQGNYTSTLSGVIEIDGIVQLKGNFVNNSGNIHANSTGILKFSGTAPQQISGTAPTDFYCEVEVDNAGNGVSLTGADAVLYDALTLTNGKFTLTAYYLTMAAVGITATSANYVVTGGTGELIATVGAADVTYPVGTASSYNPVVLNNNGGSSDTYGVVYSDVMPAGWSGTDHAVTGNWAVTEGNAGGSLLDVTAQWNLGQEQTSFTRTDCAVGVFNGTSATWTPSGAAGGTDPGPYTRLGSDFTSLGSFVVGDYFFEGIELDVDLFLGGPYSTGTMSTAINGIIPLDDPYDNGPDALSIPATAVDWIEIELRDKITMLPLVPAYSRSFFLDASGNVMNVDGTAGAKLQGIPKDEYYIAVMHRNHLGIVSSSTVNLNLVSPAWNFKTAQTQAWQDILIGNAAMYDLGDGSFGLWPGDASGDGIIRYPGGDGDRTSLVNQLGSSTLGVDQFGYSNNDLNMDGIIRYPGGDGDRNVLVTVLGSSTLGVDKFSHLP